MDDSRFFKRLWRVNAVVLLVVLLGIAGNSVYWIIPRGFRSRYALASNLVQYDYGASLQGQPVVKAKWRYGDPQREPGGSGFIVPLYSTWNPDDPKSYCESLRNLLFVDENLGSRRWLMPDNEQEISSWEFLKRGGASPAIMLKTWEKDPDAKTEAGDAVYTLDIHLARPDCTGLVPVLDGLTRCVGSEFVGEKHLTLFHVKDGAGYASKIALADFSVVATASLALLD